MGKAVGHHAKQLARHRDSMSFVDESNNLGLGSRPAALQLMSE